MQYTEGPWWVEPSADGSADGREVCDGYGHTATVYGESDVAEANARLIAAAPELLRELKHLLAAWEESIAYEPSYMPLGDAARAVIAKAEGRSE